MSNSMDLLNCDNFYMTPEENAILQRESDKIDYYKLKRIAEKRAILEKLTSYYKKCIDNEVFEEFSEESSLIMTTVKNLKSRTDSITDTKQESKQWCFFTINCNPEVVNIDNINDFVEYVDKHVKTAKYFKDNSVLWTFEQRSDVSGEYHGFHCHMLFKKTIAPSKLQTYFKTKYFDKWVGNPSAIDYKYIDSSANREKYIMGQKDEVEQCKTKGKEKMMKVAIDREMRKYKGIHDWYSYNYDVRKNDENNI